MRAIACVRSVGAPALKVFSGEDSLSKANRYILLPQPLILSVLCIALSAILNGCAATRMVIWEDHYIEYRVKRGENLALIGERFHVSSDELAEINDIDDPRKIPTGLVLKIPFVEGSTNPERIASKKKPPKLSSSDNSTRASLGRVNISKVMQYKGALIVPVEKAKLTSKFGWRWLKFHEGIDIAAPEGTKVLAAHDGHVVYVSESFSGYGKIVVVKGNNLLTVYAHNRKNRASVGDQVEQGDWIADVGKTGDATGSHLHFETRVKDEEGGYAAVDPMTFIGKPG
jgi:murein DD-endopeptidase MepM/ murein hydrolase activator NlpD